MSLCLCGWAVQARIDAQAESFDRTYSVPEAMDAPLLESALPVSNSYRLQSSQQQNSSGLQGRRASAGLWTQARLPRVRVNSLRDHMCALHPALRCCLYFVTDGRVFLFAVAV